MCRFTACYSLAFSAATHFFLMLRNSIRLPVSELRPGMFVAALDRDWRETAFPLQGFRIDDAGELEKLRAQCAWVTIDPTHSASGSFEHLPDLHVAEKRFDSSSWLQRLRDRFARFAQASQKVAEERARLGLLPPDVVPVLYGDVRPIDEELRNAEAVYQKADVALERITRQVANGETVDLDVVGGAVENMVESAIANPDALLWVARIREEDGATCAHAIKVAVYLLQLGRHLGFPPAELGNLGAIGLSLDLGKNRVDRNLLLKKDKLTAAEFTHVKQHVALGLAALEQAGTMHSDVRDGIAQHHERLNGSGYPRGLAAGEIGIYGRMAAIADSFAALTTHRPYAAPRPAYDALKLLHEECGTRYSPALVEQFVQAIGVFPAGSLVELSSGEVATVLAHNRVRRIEPRVLVLTDTAKKPIYEPISLDLVLQPKAADGSDIKIVRGLPAGAHGLDLRRFYFA